MKSIRIQIAALVLVVSTLAVAGVGRAVEPGGSAAVRALVLWVDQSTGQVFIRPGKGRSRLEVRGGMIDTRAIENTVEKRVRAKTERSIESSRNAIRAELLKTQNKLQAENAALSKELTEMRPAWREFGARWLGKIKLSTVVYADYRFYTHSGFGPQFLTQIARPGPGNDSFNSFDINRAYLNFYFSPTKDFTLRVTPNIFRSFATAGGDKLSRAAGVGSTVDGNLAIRLKYAYIDWNTPFELVGVEALKGGKVTFGQQTNPLIDWEEHLYGFRYASLVPWNYLSLSSTQPGLAIKGPVRIGERKYLDYHVGVFNNGSFSQAEKGNTKQAMARLTAYPFGTKSRLGGLGITGFIDYGWTNAAPDITGPGRSSRVTRLAALIHYTAETWGIAGEFDYGKNAFRRGNLFKGSGPSDAFGVPSPGGIFAGVSALAGDLQNDGNARQIGYAFFGHYGVPHTPFTIFGLFQELRPNTNARLNPFDFQRIVAGVEYKYNDHLRFAVTSQNLTYFHDQFTFPASGLSPSVAAMFSGGIKYAVPRDTHAVFLNLEFKY